MPAFMQDSGNQYKLSI